VAGTHITLVLLHKTAHVAWELAGVFQIITDLLVERSEYTAAAIASFLIMKWFLLWTGMCLVSLF
jgi:hypothetical protein